MQKKFVQQNRLESLGLYTRQGWRVKWFRGSDLEMGSCVRSKQKGSGRGKTTSQAVPCPLGTWPQQRRLSDELQREALNLCLPGLLQLSWGLDGTQKLPRDRLGNQRGPPKAGGGVSVR